MTGSCDLGKSAGDHVTCLVAGSISSSELVMRQKKKKCLAAFQRVYKLFTHRNHHHHLTITSVYLEQRHSSSHSHFLPSAQRLSVIGPGSPEKRRERESPKEVP